MKLNLVNFALFQLAWFAAVAGAGAGHVWYGPAAVAVFLVIHLVMIPTPAERGRELVYVTGVGVVGAVLDSVLRAIGALTYPTSEELWTSSIVPPWIISLWVAFALLPRFSLAWLTGRTRLAVALGAVGGPLSFLAGTRFGAIAPGSEPVLTWIALAIEYAVITPLLLAWSPAARPVARPELTTT